MIDLAASQSATLDARLAELRQTRPDCLYYAVTLTGDTQDRIIFATQTQWVGWSDGHRKDEVRRARLVYPRFVELWIGLDQPYVFVHSAEDISLFLLGGGNALIEQHLATEIFPFLLESEASIHDGEMGFADPGLLGPAAFRRAPTPNCACRY